MMVVVMVFLLFSGGVAEAYSLGYRTIDPGMAGGDVAELQGFLIERGYITGSVDGLYGPRTRAGIALFQEETGLPVTGIVTRETLGAILEIINSEDGEVDGDAVASALSEPAEDERCEFNFTPEEMDLFARIVHAEAEGESFTGQVAVAASILNRIRSSRFPNTLRAVVYQVADGCYQYSPVPDGRINRPAGDSARRAVAEALAGNDPSRGATGFYNPRKTGNQWVRRQPVTFTIGNHVFFS
jgi:N-acetylmuramoyl-L-alanine amidase